MATAQPEPEKITQKSKQLMPKSTKALMEAPNKPFKSYTCESETIVLGGRKWYTFGLTRYPSKKVMQCTNDETQKKVSLFQYLTGRTAN